MSGVRARVRVLLGEHVAISDDDLAPIELDSFTLVVVIEDLEVAFGIQVAARDAKREHFGSVAQVCAYVEGKLQ
jgi:acyl carrier protein